MFSHVDPPRPGGDGIPFVRRLRAGEEIEATICWHDPTWLYSHYSSKSGTSACTAKRSRDGTVTDVNGCDGCKSKDEERMMGFLWVHNATMTRMEFLRLTPKVWFQIQCQANGQPDLRGYVIFAKRGKTDNARLTIALTKPPFTTRPPKWKEPPSPDASVRKLMRL